MGQRTIDRIMLLTAYVLLVVVVVGGGLWLQTEFNRAEDLRCQIGAFELDLLVSDVFIGAQVAESTPEDDELLLKQLDTITASFVEACPDTKPTDEDGG